MTNLIQKSPELTLDLVQGCYRNAQERLGLPQNVPIFVGFHTRETELEEQYEAMLGQYLDTLPNPTRIIRTSTKDVTPAFTNATAAVETKYYLQWEHDWLFERRACIVSVLLEMEMSTMADRHNINYVRFNQFINNFRPNGLDYYLEPNREVVFQQMMYTLSWNNNPHIARTSFSQKYVSRIALLERDAGIQEGGFVESPVSIAIAHSAKVHGVEKTKQFWGTHIYGTLGAKPAIRHLHGRGRVAKIGPQDFNRDRPLGNPTKCLYCARIDANFAHVYRHLSSVDYILTDF